MTTMTTKHKAIAGIGLFCLIIGGIIIIILYIPQRSEGQPLIEEAVTKEVVLTVTSSISEENTNFGPDSGRLPVPKEQQSNLRPPILQNATPVLSGQVALNLTPFMEPIFYQAQRSVADLKAWYERQMTRRSDTVVERTDDMIIFSSTQDARTEVVLWGENGQTVFVYYLAE